MTTAHVEATRPVTGPATPAWAARMRRAWAEHRAYRTTLAELRALTEDQLRDLGLRRDALRSIAREAARKI